MLSSPQQEDCLLLTIIGQGLKTNVKYVASVALKGTGMRHFCGNMDFCIFGIQLGDSCNSSRSDNGFIYGGWQS